MHTYSIWINVNIGAFKHTVILSGSKTKHVRAPHTEGWQFYMPIYVNIKKNKISFLIAAAVRCLGCVSQTDWSSLRYSDQHSFSNSGWTEPLHKGTNAAHNSYSADCF